MTRLVLIASLWLAALALSVANPGLAADPVSDPDPAGVADYQWDPASELASQPLIQGVGKRVDRRLSLSEAVALGMENNLDVEIQRYVPALAGLTADQAWGAFDPVAGAEVGYQDTNWPTGNALQGQDARHDADTADGRFSVGTLLPYVGATLGIEVSGSQDNSNSPVQILDPEWNGRVSITTSIPVMRGLIWNEPWTNVKVTEKIHEASVSAFTTQVMDLIQFIEVAYWDLVAQKEQLHVAQKSLETTEALLDQTKVQYEVGVVSKVDVVEAEAGVAERAFNVIVAENGYYSAQDALVDLVLGRDLTGTSNFRVIPLDNPENYQRYQIDVSQAVGTAMAKRTELDEIDREIERQEIQVRFAKNQRLPQFDVQGNWTAGGLSGDTTDRFENDNSSPRFGSLGEAFGRIYSPRGGDDWGVRGVFSIPIPNTAARKGVSKSKLELRRALTQKNRIEQQVILEVRNTIRVLESSVRGIEAADRRRTAAAEQLRAERIRLEHGESTPFDVLQRERDLVDAESQRITALQTYHSAAAALDRAQGTILDEHDIVIDEVASLR